MKSISIRLNRRRSTDSHPYPKGLACVSEPHHDGTFTATRSALDDKDHSTSSAYQDDTTKSLPLTRDHGRDDSESSTQSAPTRLSSSSITGLFKRRNRRHSTGQQESQDAPNRRAMTATSLAVDAPLLKRVQIASSDPNMSKRDFKKVLKREMKDLKKARVKSFKQRKALMEMEDIEEVSQVARLAEENRRRRTSKSSARSSITSTADTCYSLEVSNHHDKDDGFDVTTPATCQSTPSVSPSTVTICAISKGDFNSDALKLPLAIIPGPAEKDEVNSSNHQGDTSEPAEEDIQSAGESSAHVNGIAPATTERQREEQESAPLGEKSTEDLSECPTLLPKTAQTIVSAVSAPVAHVGPTKLQELLDAPKAKQEADEACSTTSDTSLMTHETDVDPSAAYRWDEDFVELEESTKELRERIQKLQQSLEQTQQREKTEVEQARAAVCSDEKKQAVAEEIRKQREETLAQQRVQSDGQSALIDALHAQNKIRRRESQGHNFKIMTLMKSTARLEKATQESKVYVREILQILVKPLQDKHNDLVAEEQLCGLHEAALRRDIVTARVDAKYERMSRRIYRSGVAHLLHLVQHRAWSDNVLLAAINEMPPVVVTDQGSLKKLRAKQEEPKKRASFLGLW